MTTSLKRPPPLDNLGVGKTLIIRAVKCCKEHPVSYNIFPSPSQLSLILNPWIWLAKHEPSNGPDFPKCPSLDDLLKNVRQEPTLLNIVSPTQYHICTNSDQHILKTVSISVPSNIKCMHAPDLNWMAFIEIQHKSYFQSNIVKKKLNPSLTGLGWSALHWELCPESSCYPRLHSFSNMDRPRP